MPRAVVDPHARGDRVALVPYHSKLGEQLKQAPGSRVRRGVGISVARPDVVQRACASSHDQRRSGAVLQDFQ